MPDGTGKDAQRPSLPGDGDGEQVAVRGECADAALREARNRGGDSGGRALPQRLAVLADEQRAPDLVDEKVGPRGGECQSGNAAVWTLQANGPQCATSEVADEQRSSRASGHAVREGQRIGTPGG